MISYPKILSLSRKGVVVIIFTLLVHNSLSLAFDSGTNNENGLFDSPIQVNSIDSGFEMPGATLYSNWYNYTHNPLGLADRNAAFYDGVQTTVSSSSSSPTYSSSSSTSPTYSSSSSSSSAGLSSVSPSNGLLPNSLHGINYNFDFQTGTIIEGIEVRILHAPWNLGQYADISVELQWNGRTLNTTSGKSDYVDGTFSGSSSNFKNVTLGSPTDLWGRTSWDAADFIDENFGVKIEVTDLVLGNSESVDVAWVKVYYSDPPIVIIDPWIEIEDLPPSVDFTLGTLLVVNWNSSIMDPSSLGYSPYNVTVFVNDSEVLTLTTWNNDTLLPIDVTSYLVAETVYNVTVKFSATNGTDWIFKEVSILVNVLANTSVSSSSSSSSSTTSSTPLANSTTTDSKVDELTTTSSPTSGQTDSTSDGSPSTPLNLIFGLVFFIGITMIRRKK